MALRCRAAGGARGSLERTRLRSSEPGEIPPAQSQPAAGTRPGHCGPRRRSALSSCRELAAPAPSGPTRALHPQLTQCPARLFRSTGRAVLPGPLFAVGSVYCTRRGMATPAQTYLCRCRSLARLPCKVEAATGEGRKLPRSCGPLFLR